MIKKDSYFFPLKTPSFLSMPRLRQDSGFDNLLFNNRVASQI